MKALNIVKILFSALFLLFSLFSSLSFADELDKKIGQMIIVGFSGDDVNSNGYQNILKHNQYQYK